MSQRKAVTKAMAVRYRSASKTAKALMLDELCALTGWHRDHARKALRTALRPRPPVYGEEVMAALRRVWAVLDAPAGKRLAPFLPEIVARLWACGELDISDETAAQLCSMSAATIDRRLAPDRAKLQVKGRSGTKPGSLLKSQIPIRTWADWDDARPGFVEIDCVGHEGGDPRWDFCQSLDVTDIATGWTEPRAVKNKAQRWVFAAPLEIRTAKNGCVWVQSEAGMSPRQVDVDVRTVAPGGAVPRGRMLSRPEAAGTSATRTWSDTPAPHIRRTRRRVMGRNRGFQERVVSEKVSPTASAGNRPPTRYRRGLAYERT